MKVPPDLAQTLLATVEHGSLDAAARVLHLTPSAVSQRLAALERITGQVLLVRSRPVRATAAGEAVVRYARQIEHLDADVAADLGIDHATRVDLPIAVSADALATWLLPALARATSELDLTVDLRREDEAFTTELLVEGAVVAAVTTRSSPVPGCSVTALGAMTYRAVATPGFVERWLPRGIDGAALAVAPVVDFDRRDDLQSRWLLAVGADPAAPPRHRIPSSGEFAGAIAAGMGWGLLPAAQRMPWGERLVQIGGPELAVALYWQQWRARSTWLDALAAAVIAAAREALDPIPPAA